MADKACKVCNAVESRTIDRLLAIGYGPPFIAARWDLKRNAIKNHRGKCLVGDRLADTVADLERTVNG